MLTFRIALGWRIFLYVLAAPIILLGLFMTYFLFTEQYEPGVTLVLAGVCLVFVVGMGYVTLDAHRWKLVLTHDTVSLTNARGTRSLARSAIKGYRLHQQYVFIVPTESSAKDIKVSQYIGYRQDLINWLLAHYANLDQVEALAEEQQIIADPSFGISTEARQARLKEARLVARVTSIVGAVVGLWMIVVPVPYQVLAVGCMVMPVAALVPLYLYKGLIRLEQRKNSAYPSIGYGLLVPCLALGVRGMIDFDILAYGSWWSWMVTAAALMAVVALMGSGELHQTTGRGIINMLLVAAFLFCWAYGTFAVVNCSFDNSEPEVYQTQILNKRISSGRSTSYYLELAPWGPVERNREVSVMKDEYERVNPSDTVDVYLQQGALKAPWFFVWVNE